MFIEVSSISGRFYAAHLGAKICRTIAGDITKLCQKNKWRTLKCSVFAEKIEVTDAKMSLI